MDLQEILKHRQESEFLGRKDQVTLFEQNLLLPLEDRRRRFLFNIYGQGGVGKTLLMRHLQKIIEDRSNKATEAVTAYTDEAEKDIQTVMGRCAEQFEQQKQLLKAFNERYKVYRQKRQELENDPEAPQGFSTLVGSSLAQTGFSIVRGTPDGGAVLGFVDEAAATKQAGEWAAYLGRKFPNEDEVCLLQEPVKVLTPLFLLDLQRISEKHTIALFFDTYEYTSTFLDQWLRDVLRGHYGKVPANIIITIAGRYSLDRNYWMPYESLLARLPLEPFTVGEVRDYLRRKGITDEGIVKVILRLSGRLPLLVATLATETPDTSTAISASTESAIECFLKWVDEPQKRQVALSAALPRYLNQDILAVLVGQDQSETLFDWLQNMPFVTEKLESWSYHSVVRGLMLHHKYRRSPQNWADLHEKLANYYETRRNALGLDEATEQFDPTWQGYTLEMLYHRLCQSPQKYLPIALNEHFTAFKRQRAFASRLAEIISQAFEDTGTTEMQNGDGKQCSVPYHFSIEFKEFLNNYHLTKKISWILSI